MRRGSPLALPGTGATAGCAALRGSSAAPAGVADSATPTPADASASPATGSTPSTDRPTPLPADRRRLVAFETLPVTVALVGGSGRTRDEGEVALTFARRATADHPASRAAPSPTRTGSRTRSG